MATAEDPRLRKSWPGPQPAWPRRDGPFRFTVEQFSRLDELGFFEDRRVELIEGVIHEMTVNPPHCTSSELTRDVLRGVFPAGTLVREAKPLDIGRRSLPEPDLAVVEGSIRDFSEIHPTGALLVVEISDSTLRKDRTLKAHLYARAGLPDYWIVNLVDRRLEIHRVPGLDPDRRGRFRYAEVTIVGADGVASPLARPEAAIAVVDLLP